MSKKHILTFVLTLFVVFISSAQIEEEMKANADALFKKKEYIEATPLYLRLLSLQPRSYDYSFKYGTCLLFNSNSKQDAIRYLTYAIKSPTPINEAHFFLGRAYHLNYQFNDAISEYKSYNSAVANKGEFSAEAKRNIEMCENGKQLLTTITDIIVRKKTEIKQSDFFRLYDLSDIGGSIITAVDFQTKNDKKYDHKPVVCIEPKMENVYFASYGNGDNLDIYVAKKLPGGKFGLPQRLSDEINTPYDENFPYMHPNGKELYFSSKGHNSMGGYDIFKANYDAESNAYTNVTNVDFSISSPDDDILYVVDKDNKNAFFSSTRQSQDGKIVVYKVGVERIPIQLAIVKGSFSSSILPGSPQMSCEVIDKINGKSIGVFKSLKENSYLIVFPKGGKYQYKITIDGSDEAFNIDVEIPFLKEMRPLKQKMEHLLVGDQEQIKITNLFDERFEDAQSIISQVLKERANLNVNEDKFDAEDVESIVEIQKILAELNLGNRSTTEIAQLLDSKYKEASEANPAENKIEVAANGVVLNLYNQIDRIDNEIKTLIKEADVSDNEKRKETILTNVKELFEQREEKLDKIKEIEDVTKVIAQTGSSNGNVNLDKLKQVSSQFNELLKENNNKELASLLTENKEFLKSTLSTGSQSPSEKLVVEKQAIDTEIKHLQTIEQSNIETIDRLEKEIAALEQQKELAKEKFKQDIQDKIDVKNYELTDTKDALSKVRNLIAEQVDKRNENDKILAIANEIESYQGKSVSTADLAKAKTNANNGKIATLKSYVESSLAEISETNVSNPSKNDIADIAIEQYNIESEEIYSNPELSNYERQKQLLNLNKEKQDELSSYAQELDKNEATDEATIAQQKVKKDKIEKILTELNQDKKLLEDSLVNSTQKEIAKLSIDTIINEIYPDYQTNKNKIQQKTNLSEKERLQQLNENDLELSKRIAEEIKQVKNNLSQSNEKQLSQAKIALLEKQLVQTQSEIANKTKTIDSLSKDESLLAQQKETTEKIESIAQTSDAIYQKGMVEFQSANTPEERIKILTEVSQNLTIQKQSLNQLKSQNPTNTTIDTKIIGVDNKLDETAMLLNNEKTQQAKENTAEVTENKTVEITENQQTDVNKPADQQKTPESVIGELQNSYAGNIQNDFNETPTNTAEIDQTIQRLKQYKQKNEQSVAKAPKAEKETYRAAANQEIQRVDNRIKELEQLKEDLAQKEITENQQTDVNKPADQQKTPESVIGELQNSYAGNIQNDFNKTPTNTAEIDQTIQRLKQYKQKNEQSVAKAPKAEKETYRAAANQEIQRVDNRIKELEQLKANLAQQEITENQQTDVNKPADQQKTPESVIGELQNSYAGNIQNDFNKTPTNTAEIDQTIQRLKQYKQKNEQSVTKAPKAEKETYRAAANQEIQRVDNRIKELEQLKADLSQQEITENQQTDVNKPADQQKTPESVIGELQNSYAGNIQNDFNETPTNATEIDQTIQRLKQYKQKNEQTVAKAPKAEKETYRAAANQEIQRVDNRIKELEQLKTNLAQQEITENQQTDVNKPADQQKTPEIVIGELQNTYVGNIQTDFNETPTNATEIDQTIQRLNQYKQKNEQSVTKAPKAEKETYRAAANQEIQRVDNRIKELEQLKIVVEKPTIAQNDTSKENRENTDTQNEQQTNKQEIENKLLAEDITPKERKELTKELSEIKNEEAKEDIQQLTVENKTNEAEIANLQEQTSHSPYVKTTDAVYQKEMNELTSQLEKEKNPVAKELLLKQVQETNEDQLNYLKRAANFEENKTVIENNESTRIYSQEELKERRRRGIIEIDELISIRGEKEDELSKTTNKKEKQQLIQEVDAINEQTSLVKKEIEFIDQQLSLYQTIETPISLEENNVKITYNEERQIASSEAYEKYAGVIAQQNEIVNNYNSASERLRLAQKELEEIRTIETQANNQNKEQLNQQKSATLDSIKNISLSLRQLEIDVNTVHKQAISYLPEDSTEAMKFQNLVARGVNPIKKSLIAAALVPISVNGIAFNPATPTTEEIKKIPVDILSPKGLIYRVQVGAFAKPLPEGHFKEFTPVTGEKIVNTNVIRYMAGFFNNAVSVVEARDKIKQFGYNDAFVVAYCDGKRVSFGEARQMEAKGECVGLSKNEIQLEVATNIASNLELEDTTKTLKPVSEYSYNKAPGAANANAIEQFDYNQVSFTVQIGVFNKPASIGRLHNLNPLYTFRLGNGQIRYSVGLFGDLNKAIDLQMKIRNTSVKDAFVTAYYQNERISITKALELIKQGVKVHSEEDNKEEKVPENTVERPDVIEESNVFSDTHSSRKSEIDDYVQFITKKTFDDYPKDELNRYNVKGNFFYDKNDKRIKSNYYQSEGVLPRISGFAGDLDTIHFTKEGISENYNSTVTILINERIIPGDFYDWLNKLPYRKEFKKLDNSIEIRIFDIYPEDMDEIKTITTIFEFDLSETENLNKNENINE